jgi:hypothetical protein
MLSPKINFFILLNSAASNIKKNQTLIITPIMQTSLVKVRLGCFFTILVRNYDL